MMSLQDTGRPERRRIGKAGEPAALHPGMWRRSSIIAAVGAACLAGWAGCGHNSAEGSRDGGADGGSAPDADAPDGAAAVDWSNLDASVLKVQGPPAGYQDALDQARSILKTLSQDDKVNLVHGAAGPYVGNVGAVGSLPPLTLHDGPAGVAAGVTKVTAFPAGITVAASWDRDLAQRWGAAMAQEERGKGVMIQLAPMMNLDRSPLAGRNFESFGEDPYLAGQLSAATITGIQSQKVVATAKHFVGNEQETNRDSESSKIDERTLHELYYAPFEESVEAGVGAVMCSYNRLDGVYACENAAALGDLKNEMGFTGFVMSDWNATHSTVTAANAGLDMEMPGGGYFGAPLLSAVNAGSVTQSRLDDMVTRILTSLLRVGVLAAPPGGTLDAAVTSAAHDAVALEAATSGITLLKNDQSALPLDGKVTSIAVIGSAGGKSPFAVGGGSAQVVVSNLVSPFDALKARVPSTTSVSYAQGDGGASQSDAVSAAAAADAAVVFASVWTSEGGDRGSLDLAADVNSLISAVAAANARTIVVLNVPGAVLMPWLANVKAVVSAWYPGAVNGSAIAPILLGTTNPSGKLPVTFPVKTSDLPGIGGDAEVVYAERLAIGYRSLDARGVAPLFPFGHGLSYTTFSYSNLAVAAGKVPGTIAVQFTLTNSGKLAGTEVPQLYVSFPAAAGEPPLVLRGFQRVPLAPGASTTVTLELRARDLSCWNPTAHARYVPTGTFGIAVGASSRDLRLQGSIQVVGFGPTG